MRYRFIEAEEGEIAGALAVSGIASVAQRVLWLAQSAAERPRARSLSGRLRQP